VTLLGGFSGRTRSGTTLLSELHGSGVHSRVHLHLGEQCTACAGRDTPTRVYREGIYKGGRDHQGTGSPPPGYKTGNKPPLGALLRYKTGYKPTSGSPPPGYKPGYKPLRDPPGYKTENNPL